MSNCIPTMPIIRDKDMRYSIRVSKDLNKGFVSDLPYHTTLNNLYCIVVCHRKWQTLKEMNKRTVLYK